MENQGSGGMAFVSVGISEALIALVLLSAVLLGLCKVAKFVWGVFSN
jgi:hypothetical protein